jgi:hypothetical protein
VHETIGPVTTPEPVPDQIDDLKAALAAERMARQQAEARASGAEAMVAHLKLLIAKMKRERYGQSSERGQRLLDQLELQLEELEASAAEDEAVAIPADTTSVISFTRKKPVRAPLPAHLPRERVLIALADWVGACTVSLAPLVELIRRHVLAAERVHGDDTTVPVLAKGKTIIGRVDLCSGRSPVRRAGPAGGDLLLLAQSQRRASGPASGRI